MKKFASLVVVLLVALLVSTGNAQVRRVFTITPTLGLYTFEGNEDIDQAGPLVGLRLGYNSQQVPASKDTFIIPKQKTMPGLPKRMLILRVRRRDYFPSFAESGAGAFPGGWCWRRPLFLWGI